VIQSHVRAVADAVLFEGYALYPYRKSSLKNHHRWLFGVLAPRTFAELDGSEAWWMQADCLLEPIGPANISCELRFLRQRHRRVEVRDAEGFFHPVESVEVAGRRLISWNEAEVHSTQLAIDTEELGEKLLMVELAADTEEELIQNSSGVTTARVIRERGRVSCAIRVHTARLEAQQPLLRVTFRIENLTPCAHSAPTREEALPGFLEGTHLLLSTTNGNFLSLLEPPAWAEGAARACKNVRAFPVLAGDGGSSRAVLASPIILYDHPKIAPESQGDFFDATEIDEMLTLRTRAMTAEEKQEARALDPRTAAIVDRVDSIDEDAFARLHGAIRNLDPSQLDISPEPPSVAVGAKLRLHPGKRRTDAQDMFLEGMTATVRAVLRDVDDREYFAVTVDGDPAAELHLMKNRFLYFYPDEVAVL
jgi:hypothetical protein